MQAMVGSKEAARLLDMHINTFYRYVNKGEIKVMRLERGVMKVSPEALEAFKASRTVEVK